MTYNVITNICVPLNLSPRCTRQPVCRHALQWKSLYGDRHSYAAGRRGGYYGERFASHQRQKQGILYALSSSDLPTRSVSEEEERRGRQVHQTPEVCDQPLRPARLITDLLIGANCVLFALQLWQPSITLLGIEDNSLIMQGEVWRLVTAAFLHGSPSHLLLNMFSLNALGPIVEWTCGRDRYLILYLGAALGGNIGSLLSGPEPSLGASGAIFGLAGALVVYFVRNHKLFGSRFDQLVFRLLVIIVLNLVSGYFMPQIDEAGHIGGLLGGAALAYLLGPRYELCLLRDRAGVWLVDDAPLKSLTTPPRKLAE